MHKNLLIFEVSFNYFRIYFRFLCFRNFIKSFYLFSKFEFLKALFIKVKKKAFSSQYSFISQKLVEKITIHFSLSIMRRISE
jgi:hypothetical protein